MFTEISATPIFSLWRFWTDLRCSCSEWVLGGREDLVKQITDEIKLDHNEVWAPESMLFSRFLKSKSFFWILHSIACQAYYSVTSISLCNIFGIQEWWTYVCMGPADLHPNWHLGMRGTQHRAVIWRVWKEGGTGFLYWGVNCYEKATSPAAEVHYLCEFFLM